MNSRTRLVLVWTMVLYNFNCWCQFREVFKSNRIFSPTQEVVLASKDIVKSKDVINAADLIKFEHSSYRFSNLLEDLTLIQTDYSKTLELAERHATDALFSQAISNKVFDNLSDEVLLNKVDEYSNLIEEYVNTLQIAFVLAEIKSSADAINIIVRDLKSNKITTFDFKKLKVYEVEQHVINIDENKTEANKFFEQILVEPLTRQAIQSMIYTISEGKKSYYQQNLNKPIMVNDSNFIQIANDIETQLRLKRLRNKINDSLKAIKLKAKDNETEIYKD